MQIKKYGLTIEALKREGCTNRQIAEAVGLTPTQIKQYFSPARKEKRERGYPRSQKADELKTKQALIGEVKSLRMEVELLRDFMRMMGRK